MTGAVEHRSVTGQVTDIRPRIGSDGKDVVEIFLTTSSGNHRAVAHAGQATAAQNLHEKMLKLASSNGCATIKELGVSIIVEGITKDPSTTIVTAMKIAS